MTQLVKMEDHVTQIVADVCVHLAQKEWTVEVS